MRNAEGRDSSWIRRHEKRTLRRLRNAPIRTDRIIKGLVGLLLLTGMACDRSAPADSGGATPPGPGESRTVQLPNGARMDFAWIEPGTFVRGTSDEQAQGLRSKGLWEDWFENEQPAHEVTIRQGFWLGTGSVIYNFGRYLIEKQAIYVNFSKNRVIC